MDASYFISKCIRLIYRQLFQRWCFPLLITESLNWMNEYFLIIIKQELVIFDTYIKIVSPIKIIEWKCSINQLLLKKKTLMSCIFWINYPFWISKKDMNKCFLCTTVSSIYNHPTLNCTFEELRFISSLQGTGNASRIARWLFKCKKIKIYQIIGAFWGKT